MKRLFFAAACLFLQAVVCLFAARAENEYRMTAVYLENEQALSVRMELSYTNETGNRLESVLFNVYSNVFRRESALPYDNATLAEAFPYGYAPSGIEFQGIYVDGQPVRYRFLGASECHLRVDCDIEAGSSADFSFNYTLLLSENRAFQGCGEDIRLIMFYPSACVYDGGFVAEPTSRVAEFLYAEKAMFEIKLYLPYGYEIASGAEILSAKEDGDYTVYELKQQKASQLAIVAGRRFRTRTAVLPSGHTIRVLGSDRTQIAKALDRAIAAGTAYERMFGPLLGSHTDIAICAAAADMSLPGLIITGDADKDMQIEYLLAQQYFGCETLTDPQIDPFLRYGVSFYAALLSVKAAEGEETFIYALTEYLEPALKMTVPGSLTPDSGLSRFTTAYDFDVIVKRRGAAVLYEIGLAMGEDELISGLRRYHQSGADKIVNIEDFVNALDGERETTIGNALIAWLMTIDEYVSEDGSIYR